MTQSPTDEPQLRDAVDGASLIVAGTHYALPGDGVKPMIAVDETIRLSEYDNAGLIQASFATYVETKWRPWAEGERLQRRTIRVYSQLFTLQQQMEGAIIESPLELVWGVGIGIWNTEGTTVTYPLITKLVEVSLNPVRSET
jgi:hypothetical protein